MLKLKQNIKGLNIFVFQYKIVIVFEIISYRITLKFFLIDIYRITVH